MDVDRYAELRNSLQNCRIRFEREKKGRVAFLGGSITQNPGWRDMTCAYLKERFPDTEFDFIHAGIASTGSTPAAFRLQRDVFARGPVDLLLVEAAVNDSTNGRSPQEMIRGMEGVLRGARQHNPLIDLVVMHFVDPGKMASYREGNVPLVIQQHERVAVQYGASSLHLAREVTERIDAGQFSWEEDFKNLHPSPYGQRLYAASIRRLLAAAWNQPLVGDATGTAYPLPEPVDPFCYDRASLLPPDVAGDLKGFALVPACDPTVAGVGGGTRKGFTRVPMLVGTSVGDSFSFAFEGRAGGLWVAAGPDAGIIEYRVDDGEWERCDLFTPWSRGMHLPWAYVLAAELDASPHLMHVRIAPDNNPASKGNACRIVKFLLNERGL